MIEGETKRRIIPFERNKREKYFYQLNAIVLVSEQVPSPLLDMFIQIGKQKQFSVQWVAGIMNRLHVIFLGQKSPKGEKHKANI